MVAFTAIRIFPARTACRSASYSAFTQAICAALIFRAWAGRSASVLDGTRPPRADQPLEIGHVDKLLSTVETDALQSPLVQQLADAFVRQPEPLRGCAD